MSPIKFLTPELGICGWVDPVDFAGIRDLGFERLISFRPDHEVANQKTAAEAAVAAENLGMQFAQIPTTKFEIFADATADRASRAFAGRGRTLAYCASGQRAAIVWAAVSVRSLPVDEVLKALSSAGFSLDFIRDDLEAIADRTRWLAPKIPHTETAAA